MTTQVVPGGSTEGGTSPNLAIPVPLIDLLTRILPNSSPGDGFSPAVRSFAEPGGGCGRGMQRYSGSDK